MSASFVLTRNTPGKNAVGRHSAVAMEPHFGQRPMEPFKVEGVQRLTRTSERSWAVQIHDFETMYISGLCEAASIEELQLKALPVFIDAADDEELRDEFRAHHAETRIQLERV